MKNPNGFGCIKHLSGSRRNPWAFVVTENGKQKVKGYSTIKLTSYNLMRLYTGGEERHSGLRMNHHHMHTPVELI